MRIAGKIAHGHRAALLCACLLSNPTTAAAGDLATCSFSVTPLSFGSYEPHRAGPQDSTADVLITCTAITPGPIAIHVTLEAGGPNLRRRFSGQDAASYQLFVDAARTQTWGDGTGGTSVLSASGTAAPAMPFRQRLTVFGRIFPRQTGTRVGRYVDAISITLLISPGG
jgi:spore coat protein U-like protein